MIVYWIKIINKYNQKDYNKINFGYNNNSNNHNKAFYNINYEFYKNNNKINCNSIKQCMNKTTH